MTFDDWCATDGAYLKDNDDAARAAKLMARRAWADANVGTFGAVKERYPDSVKEIRATIAARLFDHEEPTEEAAEA